jgi:transcriptional regulator with XRE-family HTH domain
MEPNDYDSDITFGIWLKDQRVANGLSIEDVSRKSGISVQRLKSLEIGYAEKGITHAESQKLCVLYKIELKDFIQRAAEIT